MEPGYKLPSRSFLTNTCYKLYTSLKENLLEVLASPKVYVAITTDMWTSRAVESYLTSTAHFINSDWKLESKVLQTKKMPERQTGENIAEVLCNAIKEWKIDERRIYAVVHDTASNMNLAIEKLGCGDVPCFAHTLQLAVNNGLQIGPINKLLSVACKLVGHLKHSSLAMTALKGKQQQLNISQHHLLQDVVTRLLLYRYIVCVLLYLQLVVVLQVCCTCVIVLQVIGLVKKVPAKALMDCAARSRATLKEIELSKLKEFLKDIRE